MKWRVLIVDDDQVLARTLGQAFSEAGYDVTTAGSSEEASELCRNGCQFDLMVIDHRLPGRSGLGLLEDLKGRCAARTVLMTAYDTEEVRQKSAELGVDLYLRKPFDLNFLLQEAVGLLEDGAGA